MISTSTAAVPAGISLPTAGTADTGNTPTPSAGDSAKQAIAAYYSHLSAQTPVYAEDFEHSVLGTTHERDIQEQLQALADKAKSIFVRNEGAHVSENAGQLDRFMDDIKNRGKAGRLSREEAQYFYGKPFKAKLEVDIEAADRATGDDIRPAMERMDALCLLLGRPSRMFHNVVAKTIIDDVSASFSALLNSGLTAGTGMKVPHLTPLPETMPPGLQKLADQQRSSVLPHNARPV